MAISDVASLVGGAALGAPFSEILKLLIAEAKKAKDFKPLSQDLASTMERLVPVLKEIDLMQEGLDPGKGELKVLIKTMQRAEEIVRKCSRIQWYNIPKKALYTREIKGINQDFLKFCQIELQLIQHKNQLHSMRSMASVTTKIDLLSDRGKEFTELCLEPQPDETTIFWLDRPLRELKKILFKDGVVTIVVFAPTACGKTTLVTKLCHDADVKGKFKKIFFIALSKTPNIRLIIQRLLQHTTDEASEFEKELDARLCIKQLLKQLEQCGPILLVLDDARLEEESLLQKFPIQFPHCKVLVTSRFEFPRLGPSYYLEPMIDEDVKNLFIDCVPQPNCLSCAKRDDLLRKMLKRCNGLPLAIDISQREEKGKGKLLEDVDQVDDKRQIERYSRQPLAMDLFHRSEKGKGKLVEDDDQADDKGQIEHYKDHVEQDVNPSSSICNGCKFEIEDGISLSALDAVWHPECFCCLHCHRPIAMQEISENGKFHRLCYKENRHPNCSVCKQKIPSTAEGIEYNEHPFWQEKYCPSHDVDGTAKCCSCERLKPLETYYIMLGDGRWLCLECMESTVMDSDECQPLHFEIREFFEGLNMKIEREFPFLLVEQQALNKNKEDETIDHHHEVVIRGSCISEERIISSVSRRPRMGPNGILIDLRTESQMLVRQCEVAAVLVMYGLPRLLTGSILAHEMMHAWLRLNGYNGLKTELEDGLCQVIAHMWLESQTYGDLTDAFAASSSHMPTLPTNLTRRYDFEKKLVELYMMQIEDDYSPYGDGFRKVKEMVSNSSLHDTLRYILSSKSA